MVHVICILDFLQERQGDGLELVLFRIKLDISGSGKQLILNFTKVILLRMSQEKHFESDMTLLFSGEELCVCVDS